MRPGNVRNERLGKSRFEAEAHRHRAEQYPCSCRRPAKQAIKQRKAELAKEKARPGARAGQSFQM